MANVPAAFPAVIENVIPTATWMEDEPLFPVLESEGGASSGSDAVTVPTVVVFALFSARENGPAAFTVGSSFTFVRLTVTFSSSQAEPASVARIVSVNVGLVS